MNRVLIEDVGPRAWDAICDLLGGEDRIINFWGDSKPGWGDGFIINFGLGADTPWQPPSPEVGGWHKDGDFFRHFLDSPEQGLLTIVVWSDIYPKSGGTFVACDSVQHVAQRLYEHPEGLLPGGFGQLIDNCKRFRRNHGKRRRRCAAASVHPACGFTESFGTRPFHHEPASFPQRTDEFQSRKSRRFLTGGTRCPAWVRERPSRFQTDDTAGTFSTGARQASAEDARRAEKSDSKLIPTVDEKTARFSMGRSLVLPIKSDFSDHNVLKGHFNFLRQRFPLGVC